MVAVEYRAIGDASLTELEEFCFVRYVCGFGEPVHGPQ
jgi:hypothetical protein